MVAGISLANKCQLLFGCAVLLILASALSVPWLRTQVLVRDSQIEVARQLADAWLTDRIQLGSLEAMEETADDPLRITLVRVDRTEPDESRDPFLAAALRAFREDPAATEHAAQVDADGTPTYRYARAIRESQMQAVRDRSVSEFAVRPVEPNVADPIRAVLIVDRSSRFAEGQLLVNQIFILTAWIVAGLMAVLVFYLILTKLILSPVRQLRETAENVQRGDLTIRAQIQTGDEFQQLSEAFNGMLEKVEAGQAQLRSINETLDLKIGELSEANIGLFESNRLKSEFLANVSHELRTPLNSIIGFAELLQEMAAGDPAADPKRARYLANIVGSGRQLLEMINELLEMAKIEAGRMELNIAPTSIADLVEGLVGVMRPQAETKGLELHTRTGQNLPSVETDPGKLQQILYNFLSNAIKFTPTGGMVTVSAERVTRQDNSQGVRLAVADTGPGIAYDMQDTIFEKFRQVDASHTREHPGTGLGLAICRELAELLGASVSLVSEPGRGATFFVDLPLTHQPAAPQPLIA